MGHCGSFFLFFLAGNTSEDSFSLFQDDAVNFFFPRGFFVFSVPPLPNGTQHRPPPPVHPRGAEKALILEGIADTSDSKKLTGAPPLLFPAYQCPWRSSVASGQPLLVRFFFFPPRFVQHPRTLFPFPRRRQDTSTLFKGPPPTALWFSFLSSFSS